MKKVVIFSFVLSCIGVALLLWPHRPGPDLEEDDFGSGSSYQSESSGASTPAGHQTTSDVQRTNPGAQSERQSDGTTSSNPVAGPESDAGFTPELKIRELADKSPKEAAEIALRIQEPAARKVALEQTGIAWAEQDLNGATNWLASLPAGQTKEAVSRDIAYEAARTNAMVAIELAADMPPSVERDDLLVHTVSQWANSDPQTATTWAQQVEDKKLQAQLLSAIGATAAAEHGPEAAALVGESIPAGPEQQQAAVRVAKEWGQTDPTAAARWVEQFPASPARTAAIQSVGSVWREKDPAAANQWLQKVSGPAQASLH